jgi:hypothetical protein
VLTVSRTRLPPAPKEQRQTKRPRTVQLGLAPATMAKTEHSIRETLKANFRPMMSAVIPADRSVGAKGFIKEESIPQNRAPTSIPTYAAIVRPLAYPGENSRAACPAMML